MNHWYGLLQDVDWSQGSGFRWSYNITDLNTIIIME